jgi:hypothetical protein
MRHRLIETIEALAVLENGAVIIDIGSPDGDVLEKRLGLWRCGGNAYGDLDIDLPARVLLESWER